MLVFEWPWAFALLIAPVLLRYLLRPARLRERQAALRIPFAKALQAMSRSGARHFLSRGALFALALLAWALLIGALARPVWVGEQSFIPMSGRDLMLALDISGSMKQEDFVFNARRVSRLHAAKQVIKDFVDKRRGDRLALIVFATQPYLQIPLSFDVQVVKAILGNTVIGLADERQTAIGDAIGLAVKQLQKNKNSDKVLILLTDGSNNSGLLSPEEAATLAAQTGIRIYTIGVGADQAGRMRLGLFAIGAELDEATLKMIASKTKGRYFRAKNTGELKSIYALLDKLEEVDRDEQIIQIRSPLYVWPLSLALLLATLVTLLFNQRRRHHAFA